MVIDDGLLLWRISCCYVCQFLYNFDVQCYRYPYYVKARINEWYLLMMILNLKHVFNEES